MLGKVFAKLSEDLRKRKGWETMQIKKELHAIFTGITMEKGVYEKDFSFTDEDLRFNIDQEHIVGKEISYKTSGVVVWTISTKDYNRLTGEIVFTVKRQVALVKASSNITVTIIFTVEAEVTNSMFEHRQIRCSTNIGNAITLSLPTYDGEFAIQKNLSYYNARLSFICKHEHKFKLNFNFNFFSNFEWEPGTYTNSGTIKNILLDALPNQVCIESDCLEFYGSQWPWRDCNWLQRVDNQVKLGALTGSFPTQAYIDILTPKYVEGGIQYELSNYTLVLTEISKMTL